MNKKENKNRNYAFIDGQNLYYGTAKLEEHPWKINLARFRIYLEQKYNVVMPTIFWDMYKKQIKSYTKEFKKPDLSLYFENIIQLW